MQLLQASALGREVDRAEGRRRPPIEAVAGAAHREGRDVLPAHAGRTEPAEPDWPRRRPALQAFLASATQIPSCENRMARVWGLRIESGRRRAAGERERHAP